MREPQIDLVVPGDPATRTGGYLYDRRILDGLEALGWRTEVLALDGSFPHPTSAALAHARSTFARIPSGRAVVIDGLALGGLAPLLEAEANRLRLIALVHHPLAAETGLDRAASEALRQAEQDSLAAVERTIVTSDWTARALLSDYGLAAERIRVVVPGTDPVPEPQLSCAGGTADRDLATRDDHSAPLRLLCVATLTPRKGHRLLIDALAPLSGQAWQLDCIGSTTRDPAEAVKLRRQVEKLGLAGRVIFHGELSAPALGESYRRADVFVLASFLEGYGMAIAEALAHGLPVISTTAGAIPDTAAPEASVLVPPGDRAALTAALGSVIEDGNLLSRLARNARRAASALPDWPEASARFAAAIGDLAGRSSGTEADAQSGGGEKSGGGAGFGAGAGPGAGS